MKEKTFAWSMGLVVAGMIAGAVCFGAEEGGVVPVMDETLVTATRTEEGFDQQILAQVQGVAGIRLAVRRSSMDRAWTSRGGDWWIFRGSVTCGSAT